MSEFQDSPIIKKQIVAVFDLDGTLTRSDTYVRYLIWWLACHPGNIIRCWHLPFCCVLFYSGYRDNTWLKKKFFSAIVGGARVEEIERRTRQFVSWFLNHGMRSGAISALRAHQERGDQTILLSASFDIYVKEFSRRLGFSKFICTKAKVSTKNRLTGTIDGENCYGIEKLSALVQALEEDRSHYYVIAYTDHHSDYPLMQWADQRTLVSPSRKTLRIAKNFSWNVVFW